MSFGKKIGLSGLTIESMKKHPAIIPMYLLGIAGAALAAFYVGRLATQHPEVTWSHGRGSNPEPWNDYANKQYKFVSSGRDYSKGTPAPKFK